MATIEQRSKEIVYKKRSIQNKELIPKSEKVVFFICDELKKDDFKEPFFNKTGVISGGSYFKFFSYCGINQAKNINKNALVIQKKLRKGDKIIYRAYLMDSKEIRLRDLFQEFSQARTIKENNYSLSVNDYIGTIKEEYTKKEIVYIINKIINKLIEWSLKQK
jgi:hypothetical protein